MAQEPLLSLYFDDLDEIVKTFSDIIAATPCDFVTQWGGGRLLAQHGSFGLVAQTYKGGATTVLMVVYKFYDSDAKTDTLVTFLRPAGVSPRQLSRHIKILRKIMLRLDTMHEGGWQVTRIYSAKSWGRKWHGRLGNNIGIEIEGFNQVDCGDDRTNARLVRYYRALKKHPANSDGALLKNEKALRKAEDKLKKQTGAKEALTKAAFEMYPDLEVDAMVTLLSKAQEVCENGHAMSAKDALKLAQSQTQAATV